MRRLWAYLGVAQASQKVLGAGDPGEGETRLDRTLCQSPVREGAPIRFEHVFLERKSWNLTFSVGGSRSSSAMVTTPIAQSLLMLGPDMCLH